jgi:hypothetical protein
LSIEAEPITIPLKFQHIPSNIHPPRRTPLQLEIATQRNNPIFPKFKGTFPVCVAKTATAAAQ